MGVATAMGAKKEICYSQLSSTVAIFSECTFSFLKNDTWKQYL